MTGLKQRLARIAKNTTSQPVDVAQAIAKARQQGAAKPTQTRAELQHQAEHGAPLLRVIARGRLRVGLFRQEGSTDAK